MSQSDIQSYLQQVAGTHTLGQSNLPSGVNNGNPNTVYNYKPPQGGYLPPASNAYDQWRINPLPVNQNAINWQQMANQGGFNFDLSGLAPKAGPVTPGTPFPGGNPTPVPSTGGGGDPPTPVPSTGGGGSHTPVPTGSGGNQGGGGYGGGGTNGGRGADWYDFGGDRSLLGSLGFTDKPTGSNNVQMGDSSSPSGWEGFGNMTQNDINALVKTEVPLGTVGKSLYGTPLGNALGIQQDGGLSLGQIMDFLVPGDVYGSNTGKWNLLNVLPALAARINPALGIAVKGIMNYLATHTKIQALHNWRQKNLDNKAARGGGDRGQGQYGGGPLGGDLGVEMGTGSDPLGGLFGTGGSVSYGSVDGIWGSPDSPTAGGTWGNPMSMYDFHDSNVK